MKRLVCFCLVLTGLSALATDWYADAEHGNDLWDGTSAAFVSGTTGPKKTLQAALDIEGLKSDDTLWLLPGDYKEGQDETYGLSRALVKTSELKIKSTDGAGVTFVTGENTPSAAYGYDANKGMRCLAIDPAAAGVIVDGVTLRNGCAPQGASDGEHRKGGGFYNPGNDAWLIASAITNCSAYTGGAMYGGNAYRVKSLDCTATNRGGHLYGCGWIYNCLLSGTSKTAIGGGNAKIVNTTVIGCRTSSAFAFNDEGNSVANSVILDNGNSGDGNGCNYAVSMKTSVFGAGAPSPTDVEEAKTCVTNRSYLDVKMVCGFARDARLVSSSDVAALGDSAYAMAVPIPPGYAHLDLDGAPIPTDGTVVPGCHQVLAAQTASRVVFKQSVTVKGYDRPLLANEWLYPTKVLHPDTDACVLGLKPVNGKAYAVYSDEIVEPRSGKPYRHHAELDGWTDFVPLLAPESVTTVIVDSVGNAMHLYVDPKGNDEWDGLSPTHVEGTLTGPVRSPMVAVSNAVNYSTIFFAPGTYDYGFVSILSAGVEQSRRRISAMGKTLAFIGTEGAERTILVGAVDTTSPEAVNGRGPLAIGGFYMDGNFAFVKGFTITGCSSFDHDNYVSTPLARQGAAVCCDRASVGIVDCIITNNVGIMSPSVNNGCVLRTVIADNQSMWNVVRSSCYGCTFSANRIEVGNGENNSNGYCDGNGLLAFCSVDFRNSLQPKGRYKILSGGSAAKCCALAGYLGTEAPEDTITHEDPLFAASMAGDFRLGVLSPAIGRMAWSGLTPFERIALARDISGRRVTIDADGRIPLGAVNNAPFLPCVTLDVKGAEIPFASDSLVRGTNVVTAATATLSVETPTKRPFAGFEVNGVLEETASLTLTDFTPGENCAVTVLSGTNWYVDANGGDDLSGGGSPGLAKKTIRCATTNAVAHDVINVMPGIYGEAEGAQDCGGRKVKARVRLPANVMLVSTEGAEKTFIVGAASANPEDAAGLGLGPDAIRCVWMDAGSILRGFTVTGGRTSYTTMVNNVDTMAAGVYSETSSGGALVDACVISNNCAKNGAGAMYVDLRRCRILENRVTGAGPASHSCRMVGCFIDRNVGDDTTMAALQIESTTFGFDNRDVSGSGFVKCVVGRSSSDKLPILNSVFCRGRLGDGPSWYACATNCVFNVDDFGDVSKSRLFATNCCNCVVTNLDAIGVAADGRLLATSPAIDLGDAEIASAAVNVNGSDAYGTQRIYNGALDAGAAEFDWRPAYGKALNRRVSVEVASPEVTLADRTLVLPSGELAGTVAETGAYRTTVSVTGKGTLDLYVADALRGSFTKADGPTTVALKDVAAGDSFRFAYTPGDADDGAGLVTSWKLDRGLVLIFR